MQQSLRTCADIVRYIRPVFSSWCTLQSEREAATRPTREERGAKAVRCPEPSLQATLFRKFPPSISIQTEPSVIAHARGLPVSPSLLPSPPPTTRPALPHWLGTPQPGQRRRALALRVGAAAGERSAEGLPPVTGRALRQERRLRRAGRCS